MSVLRLENISYHYTDTKKDVIKNLSYTFEKGKVYSIIGRSGAGKTTLLSLLSGLASPTKGSIFLEDKNIENIDKYIYRSRDVGVIFQNFNLLPKLTAAENVVLSMDIAGIKEKDKKSYAEKIMEDMGISREESGRRVLKLSGGQQQRVAIARALSYGPKIVLADEPTGNLDQETQKEIMAIFKRLAHEEEKCVILVTHSPEIAVASDIVYDLGMQGR